MASRRASAPASGGGGGGVSLPLLRRQNHIAESSSDDESDFGEENEKDRKGEKKEVAPTPGSSPRNAVQRKNHLKDVASVVRNKVSASRALGLHRSASSVGSVRAAAAAVITRRSTAELGGLKSADEGDEADSEEQKDFEGIAAWTARLQSNDEVLSRRRDCSRSQVQLLEVALPAVAALPASQKYRLFADIDQEIESLLQVLARQAYNGAKGDWKEKEALKKELRELEERVSNAHKMYLREMSEARDKRRSQATQVLNDVNEIGVHFYEPLQCLTEDVRSLCLTIIDERLKAIFNFKPELQEKTNAVEMARLENQVARERMIIAERNTVKLQEKVLALTDRVNRQDKRAEKAEWDLSSTRAELYNARQEAEVAMNELRTDLEAENEARLEFERNRAKIAQDTVLKLQTELDRCLAENKELRSSRDALGESSEAAAMLSLQPSSPGSLPLSNLLPGTPGGANAGPASPMSPSRRVSRTSLGSSSGTLAARLARPATELWQVVRSQRKSLTKFNSNGGNSDDQKTPASRRGSADSRFNSFEGTREPDSPRRISVTCTEEYKAQVQELTLRLKLREQSAAATESELAIALREVEALKAAGAKPGKRPRGAPGELEADLAQAKAEAQAAKDTVEVLRGELTRERNDNRKADQQRAAIAAERARDAKARATMAQELRDVKALLATSAARNENLEVSLSSLENKHGGNLCSMRAKAVMEEKIKEREAERKRGLQEKVVVAREQVTSVLQENQALRLALQDLQAEVGRLTEKLRQEMPQSESEPGSQLEEVLKRMEIAVREDGAGKYIRLYQEGMLRDIQNQKLREVREGPESARTSQVREAPETGRVLAPKNSGQLDIEAPEPPAAAKPGNQPSGRMRRLRPGALAPDKPTVAQDSGHEVCMTMSEPVSPLVYLPKRGIGQQQQQSAKPTMQFPKNSGDEVSSPVLSPTSPHGPSTFSRRATAGRESTGGSVASPRLVVSSKAENRGSLLLGRGGGMVLTNSPTVC